MPTSLENDDAAKVVSDLVMPKLGLTMTEGVLAEWRVQPGDRVRPGDILFVVETDKIANEIEAQGAGEIMEILVDTGASVPVGTPLARWTGGAAEEDGLRQFETEPPASARRGGNGGEPEQAAGSPSGPAAGARLKATPLARRMARERGVDLRGVAGSGPGGRIKAADIEAAADAAGAESLERTSRSALRPVAVSSRHLAMARRVEAAKRDTPHFYLIRRAEVSALMGLRQAINAAGGPKVTVSHLLLKAVGRALLAFPDANCIWSGDSVLAFPASDVGMVVDTPDGLFIPILRDVGRLPLDRLALAANELIERARTGTLRRDDLEGGAVSVSNLGMAGVESVAPIINPPQSSILGTGTVSEAFRPDEAGRPELRRELVLTLACDHRLFDGMTGARFLAAIVHGLEAPHSLLATTDR